MNNPLIDNKKRQKINLAIAGSVGIALILLLYTVINGDKPMSHKKNTGMMISHGADTINIQDVWMERSENRLHEQEKQLTELKQQLINQPSKEDASSIFPEAKALLERIEELEDQLLIQNRLSSEKLTHPEPYATQQINMPPLPTTMSDTLLSPDPSIMSYTLELTPLKEPKSQDKWVDTYLPIGAFGKAIILGGVDAATSLTAQSDPRPLLMRLVDHGRLPKNIRSHIKDCHVVGAAYGDISSERVYVRLETLSCTTMSGEVFEKPLHGYVAGEDGKDGIRGRVVWREGALLQRAFLSGAAAGLGEGVADSYVTESISPLGTVNTVDGSDLFKSGLAKGTSSALDRLAEYHIERAEAYQPIIEIEAGRSVEIVINHQGVYLDNPTLKEASWQP